MNAALPIDSAFGGDAEVDNDPGASAVIMMVDDEPLITEVTQTYLEEAGYRHFVACHDPREALALMHLHRPAMVMLDLMMPQVSGFEVLEQARADEQLKYTPIVVLTSASGPETKLRALELGATEFLSKPVDPSELVLRVRNTLAFKLYQDRLANLDTVTGVSNRQTFTRDLRETMVRCAEHDGQLALLQVDLEQFRQTRETLGPQAADALLKAIARRLAQILRAHLGSNGAPLHMADGRIGRLGNQEFGVLLKPLSNPKSAATLAERVLSELSRPFIVQGHQIFVTPAVGIALFPSDGLEAESLIRNADLACSKAAQGGRQSYAFFSEELTVRSLERLTLTNELRRALGNDELRLHYQPKLCVKTGRIIGAEALVRWQHPEHGLLPPGRFIPLAEESDLIVDVGAWVLATACSEAARWSHAGLGSIKVAVNVSKAQFESGKLYELLRLCLAESGLPPSSLMIEITESVLVADSEGTRDLMNLITELGVALSIDDFGTGYSSLSYLKRLPVGELKVDRSFIVDLLHSREDVAIVRTVVALGQSLGMAVVAEGVESEVQLHALRDLGCDHYQGFYFSKALPNEQFVQRVLRHRSSPTG
ncbi:MAG: EAL domain-containing response regulator [Aquabacterium sp.]|nr:MAG: EAL domain-containing response regulator [Aquabacterium sp.]